MSTTTKDKICPQIRVISELYYPEETSTGYFLTKIAEGLASHFNVSVITTQPTYSARGLRSPAEEIHNNVHIHRCWTTTLNKDVFLFRIINLITISLSFLLKSLWQIRKNDIVLTVTNPPLLPLLIAVVCKIKRAKFVLLVHDLYPEVLVATGIASQKNFFIRLFDKVSTITYRSARQIIVLGRDMQTLITRKIKYNHNRVVIIPNWADLDKIFPEQHNQNELLKELELNNKFVVQYSGNIGRTHGIEVIIEAARRLCVLSEIHFLFIGWGAKKRLLEESVRIDNLNNVTILHPQTRDKLSTSLNACDVSIISFIEGMAGMSVPSRMYNVMAAGKPMIAVADRNSELALVLQEENIGWIVSPKQSEQLINTIMIAWNRKEQLREMGQRARLAAEKKYSLEYVINSYVSIIKNLSVE